LLNGRELRELTDVRQVTSVEDEPNRQAGQDNQEYRD
jgi:hypothetical protein